MIADVRERLHKMPFVPFLIRTSDGRKYSVPTVDHAFITPRGNRVVVVTDDGATNVLGPLHINSIVDQQANGE
jgi:outer membrane lipoprotein SlyB